MKYKSILLFALLLILAPKLSFGQCHPDDYKALKAFYDAAHEHKWLLGYQDFEWNNEDGWDVGQDTPPSDCDMASWFGVTLDSEGRVSKLTLPNNRMFGVLPEEFGLLKNLEELDLSNNGLFQQLPSSFKHLTKLKKIDLSQNGFLFAWWDLYEDMEVLEELYLQENDFQEDISYEYMAPLLSLPNIQIVDLSRNIFHGHIWTDFPSMISPSLVKLDLSDNHISGCYKDEWRQLSNIVDLSKNHLCMDWNEFVEKGLPDLSASDGEFYDKWWRPIGENPVVLVDWEGFMSNPEIILNIVPPSDMNYPMSISLEYEGAPMIYFMQAKSAFGTYNDNGYEGIYYADYLRSIHMGIQPDRNFENESYELKITFNDGNISKTIKKEVVVIDHDYDSPMEFDVEIDFSLEIFPEGGENLFAPGSPARIESEAALNDIAYFLADPKFENQIPGTHCTDILSKGDYGQAAEYINYCNQKEYSDFYMVVTGLPFDEIATGGPVGESFAIMEGKQVSIPTMGVLQMGGVKLFTQDNHPEWYYDLNDEAWWKADIHLGGCPREENCEISMIDYYGNMQHESIHVLAMENRYPQLTEQVLNNLRVSSDIIRKFSGRPYIKAVDISPHVGFRNTSSRINNGRELTDRAYLGVMQAAGREIRETTSLMHVRIENSELPDGLVGAEYTGKITAAYGIPSYNYQVVAGNLPPGLVLDSFTGQIHGTAGLHGEYEFAIHIADQDVDNIYNSNGVTDTLTITIEASDLENDGFFSYEDCDDSNPAINPDQSEIPYNGIDDDCDATTPDDDLDQDGFLVAEDCDDENSAINPDADEIPGNQVDENCDNSLELVAAVAVIGDQEVSVFPNPVQNSLYVQMNDIAAFTYSIYDLNGRKMQSGELNQSRKINVSSLSSGAYLLQITLSKENQSASFNFIKN